MTTDLSCIADRAQAVAIQPRDGSVVAVGFASGQSFAVARYLKA